MRYFISLFLLFFAYSLLPAQKYDYNWFTGERDLLPGPPGNFVINFNEYPVQVKHVETDYFMNATQHSMSDKDGNFLYYSNGCSLWQYGTPPVLISDDLNSTDWLCSTSEPAVGQQHGLFSIPNGEGAYFIFGFSVNPSPNCYFKKFFYHIVKFTDGAGTMEEQDHLLAEGCFNGATATRHANGRDWWILLSDLNEHKFRRWLLTPAGLTGPEVQDLSATPLPGHIYSWYEFSPDGTKLVSRYQDTGTAIYDFDRCTGLLTYQTLLPKPPYSSVYVAISGNSRYLYTGDDYTEKLIQYDLQATDIVASEQTVAVHDGFVDSITTTKSNFGAMQRGPDGKIYIFGGITHYMHVIDFPDRAGAACHVRQRALTFPSYTWAPNAYYPTYRLGPMDGTSCDTLGINNLPLAMYHHYVEDTLVPLAVTFTNASYYEPTAWYWTFGDGSSSTEVSPVHTYAGGGTYEVCLIVSNAYGADTLCREIVVTGTSDVGNIVMLPQVLVGPNPFEEALRVQVPALVRGVSPVFRLSNALGREVLQVRLEGFDNAIPVSTLPAGIYVWQVIWQGRVMQSGKVVKMN